MKKKNYYKWAVCLWVLALVCGSCEQEPPGYSDANLKSLSLENEGESISLDPRFDPETTEYRADVPYIGSVTINAAPANSAAQVSGGGAQTLAYIGKNTKTITVTAGNGTRKTYTILVYKASNTEKQIANAADLAKIGADEDYLLSGAYRLTADIIVANWMPKGTSTRPFTGTFNGDNRTITFTGASGGLFAYTKNAKIQKVKVAGTIHAEASGNKPVVVGGIVGSADNTTIENCESGAALTAVGRGYNTSAGGIAGTMTNKSKVTNCRATGGVTLTVPQDAGSDIMLYAGGIAGYSGTGAAGSGSSGCVIEASRWEGGEVSAAGPYAYAGGICGYNYTGAVIRRCFSVGTVKAYGRGLPYAGGIAGYNSRNVGQTAEARALIENCYSTAAVTAESESKAALAGGITGANAAGALVASCYARGAVTAKVKGDSAAGTGGSLGVPAAANAGGIAGAQYFAGNGNVQPRIERCAALNTAIAGADTGTGAAFNVYRIAGTGADSQPEWAQNIAYSGIPLTQDGAPLNASDKTASGKDGADCAEQPAQSAYSGWDFVLVWEMSGAYPVLRE